ncbi:MAG: PAS domain-containing protein [Chloroflexi bacterium]|nr:PAS domain-containing protein [Chloroflexota bacterium]
MPRDGSQEFAGLEDWLAQHSREVVILCEPDGRIISASPASAFVLGYEPDALRGRSLYDFMPPEQATDLHDTLQDPGTAAYRLEHPARHRSGRLLWLETTAEAVGNEAGEIVRLVALMRDITPRRRLEAQLRENQVRLRLINAIAFKIVSGASLDDIIHFSLERIHDHFPQLRVAFYTLDEDGFLRARQVIETTDTLPLTGSEGDLTPWPAYLEALRSGEVLVVEDVTRDRRLAGLEELLTERGIRAVLNVPIVLDDRTVGLLSFDTPQPYLWSAHEIALLSEIGQYLAVAMRESRVEAERQRAEESLRLAVERFRIALQNSPIVVFNQDTDLRYTWVYNPALGLTAEDVIGKRDHDLFEDEDDVRHLVAAKQQVLATGQGLRREVSVRVGERQYWFDMTIEPLRDERGQIIGITCATADITRQKEMEQKAIQLTVEQERVRVITGFIQDASHEFRTPLSVIGSSLYLMERSPDPERRHYHAEKAREQINRIVHLLEDLALMATLDTDPALAALPVDVNQLVHDVAAQFERSFQMGQLQLDLTLDNTLPPVQGDADRLRVALVKLVDNALRHTPPGGRVSLETRMEGGELVLHVADTGVGIEAAVQERVFERFYRLDAARVMPGFGLGLPIARKIVELHGGQLALDSTPAHGTTFTIRLPVPVALNSGA